MGVLVQSEDDLAVAMKPVSLHSFHEFLFFFFFSSECPNVGRPQYNSILQAGAEGGKDGRKRSHSA